MRNYIRSITGIILIGLLLRFLIAPFTMNWDLIAYTQVTHKLSSGGLTAVYQDPRSAYPPVTYWVLNATNYLLKPFLTNQFDAWLNLNDLTALTHPFIFRFMFLLKLPLIILEIISAVIFSLFFTDEKRKKALLFWMVNPVIIYVIPAFANVDIFPMFFILLSFYFFIKRNNPILSAFLLGIAASFKLFPLFFFPFLLFGIFGIKNRIKASISFLAPFVLTQIPAISIEQYRNNILAGGNSSKILFAYLPIGMDRGLMYFILFYILIFFHFLLNKPSKNSILLYSYIALVGIFSLSLFHVQWFIWLMPFIIIYHLHQFRINALLILLYLSFFGLVILQQSSLNIGMLGPIEPTLWKLDWPLKKLLSNNVYLLLNFCHTAIAASLIWIAYQLEKTKIDLG